MNPAALFSKIESIAFAAYLGVVSSLKRFESALSTRTEVLQLYNMMNKSTDVVGQVIERVTSLLDEEVDLQYAHPYDLALATYLYLLRHTASDLVKIMSPETIAGSSFWWAKQEWLVAVSTIGTKSKSVSTRDVYEAIPIVTTVNSALVSSSPDRPILLMALIGQDQIVLATNSIDYVATSYKSPSALLVGKLSYG